jgi:hypothetical protein
MIEALARVFLEILKLAPRYLIALFVISTILIYVDEETLKFIGVLDFSKDNRLFLGLTLIVTGSLFAVYVVSSGISFAKGSWLNWKKYRRVTERLHRLTENEKQILRYYLVEQTRANTLRIDDGIVQELLGAEIIYRSSAVGNFLEGFAHNISPIAWDYLHANPNLLNGSTDTYRSDKRISSWEYR